MMKRANFSAEEKTELQRAFEGGLTSVGKDKVPEIQQLAKKLKRDEKEIKNWIGNKRRSKNVSSRKLNSPKKPPQKIRAPNPYNLFVRDFFKSSSGLAIEKLAEKNKAASIRWQEMSEEERAQYYQLATQIPSPNGATVFDPWHETQRILNNMQDNCEWAEKVGVHMYYVVCNEKNHYVGGTTSGRDFLSSNPHIPASFLISTKPGVTPSLPNPENFKEMRQNVQDQLNAKYSLAVGDPHARVPYRLLQSSNVIGLPSGVKLRHPSTLSQVELEQIYKHLSTVKFVGVPPKPSSLDTDHSYAKGSAVAGSSQPPSRKRGYTTLSTGGSKEVNMNMASDKAATATEEQGIEHTVTLLTSSYKSVGTGLLMTGSMLHGHEIPKDYKKVVIQKICYDIEPWPAVKGDGEMLTTGSITAWPVKFMKNVKL